MNGDNNFVTIKTSKNMILIRRNERKGGRKKQMFIGKLHFRTLKPKFIK